jgi:uncharacterized tellurite resistance protein B-like protein
MVAEFVERLRVLFEGNPAVKRVADDPTLSAELMLLLRMVLADGEVDAAEMVMFKQICANVFGIEGEALKEVTEYLQDFGYEITTSKALALFAAQPMERRVGLARHMAEIASADQDFSRKEAELLKRTMTLLGISQTDIAAYPPDVTG